MSSKLRMGMVGGGAGAFIGAIHRLAAEMTGDIELVAGAFSRDAAASRAFGEQLGLDPDRSYIITQPIPNFNVSLWKAILLYII